jgi:tmRNA-binding protein
VEIFSLVVFGLNFNMIPQFQQGLIQLKGEEIKRLRDKNADLEVCICLKQMTIGFIYIYLERVQQQN